MLQRGSDRDYLPLAPIISVSADRPILGFISELTSYLTNLVAGQAHGLAFSVRKGVKVPPSLVNIYKEIKEEYPEFVIPKHGSVGRTYEFLCALLADIQSHPATSPRSPSRECSCSTRPSPCEQTLSVTARSSISPLPISRF